MTDREKLIELLDSADLRCIKAMCHSCGHYDSPLNNNKQSLCVECRVADHLISNGVTIPVRCKDCRFYNDDGEYCGMWGEVRHPEHFCAEGEREDNG